MLMTRFQRKKITHATTMVLLISLMALTADFSGIADLYERKTIDVRTRICRMNKQLTDDIVLVLIDESSLQAMNGIAGRWPWPRYIHGELIDYLSKCGAETIVMDIMFFENQISDKENQSRLDPNDEALSSATRRARNVIHAVEFSNDLPDEINQDLLDKPLPKSFVSRFSLKVNAPDTTSDSNVFYLPFAELLDASSGIGVVSFTADDDTVCRSEKLAFNYQNHYFPTHGTAPAIKHLGYEAITINDSMAFFHKKDKVDLTIPLTQDGSYYVNMYGRYNAFSYSGVIESMMRMQQGQINDMMVRPEEFLGKIVYVGASASATQDLKNTAIGKDVPGVFLHASICGNLLSKDILVFSSFFVNSLILIPLLFLCVFFVLFMRRISLQIYLPMSLALVYILISLLLFTKNMVIPLAVPVSAMFTAYFLSFSYISFTEGKEKRKVKNILGQYVSPAMLGLVLESSKDEYLKAEVGSKENLTVFFSDIRDFTGISERYPVESVVETLNAYLSSMVDIIFDNDGTLDKFIGDAIMAFWGAPVRFDDHPFKAVASAIRMVQGLKNLNENNKAKGLPELKIGIGIHTDNVILGNIGSRKKLDYTVIGDGVNFTSRLEGLTKEYACDILISKTTYDRIKDKICCRIADYVKVKGKDEPVFIYHVLGLYEGLSPWLITIAEQTEKAFDLYRTGHFDDAKKIYDTILETDPDDGLSRLFSERCEHYISNHPGSVWDGCHVYTTK